MPEDLKKLREAATPGSWRQDGGDVCTDDDAGWAGWEVAKFDGYAGGDPESAEKNAAFIVALVKAFDAGELVPREEVKKRLTQADRHTAERNKVLNKNAEQAQMIARLRRERDEALAALKVNGEGLAEAANERVKLRAENERLRDALETVIVREDKAWMPMQAFRSDEQVALDDAKHEAWVEAASIARDALQETGQ